MKWPEEFNLCYTIFMNNFYDIDFTELFGVDVFKYSME